ncbi:hypothetical protein NDU88_003563 [Pleurodeles waltl]|uniref:Uncharacterized protein n=1 Tax=Pleurodeles waltl TaxID=8319 RepID=A0AAV7NL02_PLEWA|nr:hypothetical protein NDU88_003563 [Pleurodeles waltl]
MQASMTQEAWLKMGYTHPSRTPRLGVIFIDSKGLFAEGLVPNTWYTTVGCKLHGIQEPDCGGKYPRSLGVPWHRWVTGSVPVLKNPVPQLAPNVGRYQRYRSKPEVRGELRVKILEEGRHFIDPCMSTWSESLCCEVPRFPTAMKDCCPGYRPDLDP